MTGGAASAAGKLFLSGEYAVLHGGTAVVTAVDRRAVATTLQDRTSGSPVVEAVRRRMEAFLDGRGGPTSGPLPGVSVRSDGFVRGRTKLGLGSSGAVAAAATGALFEWAGLEITLHRDEILEVAGTAHRDAQRGLGSGADVAVSVLGGTILFGQSGTVAATRVEARHVVVWTGKAASTVNLIDAVDRLSSSDPGAHRSMIDEMKAEAAVIAGLFQHGVWAGLADHYERYGILMERLGEAAGVPIVTPAHARIRELAREYRGGAKPSGAGGGDAAVAVFEDSRDARSFEEACRRVGLHVLDISIHGDPVSKI